ncbi:LysR family transcriptional regulator ArgP [Shimia thalassica]|uniref:LysR family transcriptional regulator ArgP n=1 Tax=Shimia thalassica TaxID=1715693 RepID=UPI002732FB00|nr:LysR family transcriptional regulator ArgP [Shimia thalassica]MDP2578674.1 LysR family transcriptional regulator ArgP [Shimia thalassica]
MNLDYAQMHALAAILRNGSFEAAATELGVTPSAISQRLKALEDQAGTLLVNRGQPCTGTDAGRRLAAHMEHVGLLEGQLAKDLGAMVPTADSRLRIAVTADSLATWVLAALAEVPGLLFDLIVDDQDFSAEWLRRGEVVAAITSHARPVSGCDSVPLGVLRYVATCSPDFHAQYFPQGVTTDALKLAPMLRFDQKDELQASWMQRQLGRKITPPSHGLPSSQGFVDACLLGLGWGMNPEPLVKAHIETGRLVPLIPDTPFDTPLFWQSSRLLRTAIDPLTRAVRKTARVHLPRS